jgi:mannitol 2-dehydrogenase
MQLNARTLDQLHPDVAVPRYDRSRLTTGIVHLGVGGFHRAHQAAYLDALMNTGNALDWAVCGVGVLPSDDGMRDALHAQDGLYTLVVKDPDGSWSAQVIGSLHEYLYAPDDPEAVVEKMASPQVRIVSLTVTEGGYNISPVTGDFLTDTPAVVHDLKPGATPTTSFGLIVEALVRRRERGLAPFTVMSCDNIQGNGDVARRSFAAYATLRSAELGDWVRTQVHFPNSMVDRITPATTADDRAELAHRFGIDDAWPVVCEPFTQWVLQESFTSAFTEARPPFEQVGVQVVEDVEPYELMKLRLLNASHQGLCYLGWLAGYRLVHEVAQDPLFANFLLSYMDIEATPTLAALPGIDLQDYKRTLISRFSNAGVRDTVARLCAESSDRIPTWLLPVVRANLAHGGQVQRAALVVASWARYAEGTDEQGEPITVVDRLTDRLRAAAGRHGKDPLAFLRDRDLFGDLVDEPRFTAPYLTALDSLHRVGARATLAAQQDNPT